MTNSVSWTPNTNPDFYFQEVGRPGLTTTQLVGYIGNATQLTALTPTLNTVRTEVEDNPVLNATEASATQYAQQDLSATGRNAVTTNELSIYPNPVMSDLTANVNLEQAGRIRMRIIDRNGKLVKQIQADANEGANKIRIDVSELAAGVYTLHVLDQHTFTGITHFVKQ
jgi:hypothetical protein